MKKYELLSEIRCRRKWRQVGQQLHKYENLLNREFQAKYESINMDIRRLKYEFFGNFSKKRAKTYEISEKTLLTTRENYAIM